MKLRRNKSEVPGLSTTATADISFMLLVFFLVTTSMYVDKGFTRQLPPAEEQEPAQMEMLVDRQNIMHIELDAVGAVSVNDTVANMKKLSDQMRTFILERGQKHIFMIDTNPECPYEPYYQVQNLLTEAYKEARETIAMQEYGLSMSQLTAEQRESVISKCPQRMSENYYEEESK